MINYFGLEIYQFPITLIIFINYIYGIYNIGKYAENFIHIRNNEIKFLYYFVIFCIFIVLINSLLYFDISKAKYLTLGFFTFFFLINLLKIQKINFKKFSFKKKIDINLKFITFFLICYFVIGSLPLSDADSLSYHSSFGAFMMKYQSSDWLKNAELIHPDFLVSGFTEIFNFIGIILFSENFGSYLNFLSLLLICCYFLKSFKSKKETSFILLCLISTPILLPMVFSQKIYILPSFVLALIFFNIYNCKKISLTNELIILSSLMLILSFKISFLYPVLIAIFYLIYKSDDFVKTLGLSFFTGLIFFAPIIIKNIYFHGDFIPPFTGQIFNQNSNYLNIAAEFLKNYDLELSFKNLVFLPILFLLPHYGYGGNFFLSFPNIGKIYGLQAFIFIDRKQKLNKEIMYIFILLISSVILSGNISTRWFLFIFFLMQLFVCNSNLKIKNIFKKLIYLQVILFSSFLLIYTIYAFPTLISKNYKESFLKKHANGYDYTIKINEIINSYNLTSDEKILYSHRSHFWTDVDIGHLNFSNQFLTLFKIKNDKLFLQKEYSDIISNNKIKILVIREKKNLKYLLRNSIFERCKYEYGSFSANHATRNIFFSGIKTYNWIYFENFSLNECLKDE